jgi:heme A synthase
MALARALSVIATTGTGIVLTALATIVYYPGRVFTRPRDAVLLGVLPLVAAGFLGWVFVKSLQAAPPAQVWSLVGVAGLLLMLAPRFVLRSSFFGTQRESDQSQAEADAEPA